MNEQNKKVPTVRFKGFTNDWEQRKLYEVADYRNGKAHEQHIYIHGNYIVVNSKFVSTSGKAKKYSDKLIEPLMKNEIAFVLSDVPNGKALARTFLVKRSQKYTLNQRVAGITPHPNMNSYFLFILMNRNPYFLKFDDGVGQTNLSKKDVEQFNENYPTKREQQKIGEIFVKLDSLLTLQQRKLDLLKQFKKGLLQKMFADKDSKRPVLRFKGFHDDWEQRKVSDIFTVTRGQVLATTKISEVKTNEMCFPVYSSQTKNNGLMGYYNKYLFNTAITWTTDGANAGTVNYREGKFYSTNVNGVLLSDDGYANKAIAEILDRVAWRHVSRVGNPKLMNNVMSNIKISIPSSFEEQNAISEFLIKFDHLIVLHQRKQNHLKLLKKSLLQQMFM